MGEPILVTVRWNTKNTYDLSTLLDACGPIPEPVNFNGSKKARRDNSHLAGSRFNEVADFGLILSELAHCQLVRSVGVEEHYHYPNSENDVSVTRYIEDDHVTIWSETMAAELGFEVRRPYDKFGFWAMLKHRGDFAAARNELIEDGITDRLYRVAGLSPRDVLGAVPIIPESITLIRMEGVNRVSVKWLWPGWAPLRKLITLDGDPGTGKSTMMDDIAARVSTGQPMPGQDAPSLPPSAVLLLSGEDDPDDTIKPRLMAAGADESKIYYVQDARYGDETMPIVIPRDVPLLEKSIRDTGARLVVIDVLSEYLDSKVDNYRDSDIRRTLHTLRGVANETNSVIIMLRHLRKEGGKAIYRGGGSIGIVGAARAGWTVAQHPEEDSLRVLAAVKMNLAVTPQPIGFKLIPVEGLDVPRVDWRGPIEGMTAEMLLSDHPAGDPDEVADKRSKLTQCIDAIREVLKGGGVWSNELHEAIVKGGIASNSTFDRARAKLDLKTTRERLPSGEMGWRVALPSD